MQPGSVLLETARPDRENTQTLFFSEPRHELVAFEPTEVVTLLSELDSWIERGYYVAGYLEYEAGFAFERIGDLKRSETPIVWFGVYDEANEFSTDVGDADEGHRIHLDPRFSLTNKKYNRRIRAIKERLVEGDVYQINFTGTFDFEPPDDPLAFYRQLTRRQPSGYNAVVYQGGRVILSCSPELFFRREGDRIWTRPMKGTIRRGTTPEEDALLSRWLSADRKTRAENLMIVDLIRNDLSRICTFGSVQVPEMFSPELYETVIQLTSTVSGTLRPGTTYREIFQALFPCGSVTGAPKVSAMKIIRNLERRRRGIYTGAIGYAGPNDHAVFSVAIRTVSLSKSHGSMGSGGGIVWDSLPDSEYRECLLKAAFLTGEPNKPDLIETLLWDGEFRQLVRHLARLARSADELGYPLDADEVVRRLDRAAADFSTAEVRVRLLLHPDGGISVSSRPISGPSIPSGTVCFSSIQMEPSDRWLYHKSTRREVYDAEYGFASADGNVEVLFLNTRGEITEGSRSNVFIRRGGHLLTPPVSCGLLPGTRRAEILESNPSARETVFGLGDLLSADEVLLCNATTPLTRVVPIDHDPEKG